MTITFHCEHCSKKIEAKDSAGGKWGKCPGCHNKVYVPDLTAEPDFDLAPIDDQEEQQKRKLKEETFQLTQNILQQKETPDSGQEQDSEPAPAGPVMRIDDEELRESIIDYLRSKADGKDEQAEDYITVIAAGGKRAEAIIDEIALSDLPDKQLEDISPQQLAGYVRKLREQIS